MNWLRPVLALPLLVVAGLADPPAEKAAFPLAPALGKAMQRIAAKGDSITSRSGGPSVGGQIETPDGRPAGGARVFMLGHYRRLAIRNCEEMLKADCTHGTTDRFGLYSFPTSPKVEWNLVVIHPSGCLVVDGKAQREGAVLRLLPWGKLEGVCRIGGRPVDGDTMRIETPLRDTNMETLSIDHTIEAKTDGEGRFSFPRVPPGRTTVGAVRPYGVYGVPRISHSRRVLVEPGKTTVVQIGGHGRPVVGTAALPPGARVGGYWQRSSRSLRAVLKTPMEEPKQPPPPIERWKREARQEVERGRPTEGMGKDTKEMLAAIATVEDGERKELLVNLYAFARMAERAEVWQETPEQKAYRKAYARYKEARRKALDEQEYSSFCVGIDNQGHFRIEDVPAGEYRLSCTWYGREQRRIQQGTLMLDHDTLCTLEHTFTIPPIPGGKSSEPLDLGTLTVTLGEDAK